MSKPLAVFKTSQMPMKYIFKDGTVGNFIHGVLEVKVRQHADELIEEIHLGTMPFISRHEEGEKAYEKGEDAMSLMRAQIIKEYEEQKQMEANRLIDNSEAPLESAPLVTPVSTTDVAVLAANGGINSATPDAVLKATLAAKVKATPSTVN